MAQAVEWILKMVDQMTAPARRARSETERLERQLARLTAATNRLAGVQAMNARSGVYAARQMDSAYGKTESTLGRLRARVGQLRNGMLALGSAGVVAAAATSVKPLLAGMSGREGNLQSLGVLLKTKDQTQIKSAAGWVSQFAAITPFEDNQVMDAVRQLLASQFSFSQTQGIARITGDAASALGSNTADAAFKWEIINRALGQVKSKGRVQGDEILQLQEAGINASKYLEAAFGKNYRKLQESGQIGANAGISAILKGLNDDFGGAMDTMSQTFSGLASTLVSRPTQILSAMYDEGALEQPKKFLENLVSLTDFSKPPGDKIIRRLAGYGKRFMDALFGPLNKATAGDQAALTLERLFAGLDAFVGLLERSAPFVRGVFDGMSAGLGALWRVLRAVMKPVVNVMKALGWLGDSNATGLGKIVGYLLAGAIALKLFGLGFGLLLGPVPAVVGLHLALLGVARVLPMLAAGGVISSTTLTSLLAILRPLTVTSRAFAIVFGGAHGAVLGFGVAVGRVWSAFLVPLLAGWSRFTRLLGTGRGLWAAARGAAMFAARFGWLLRVVTLLKAGLALLATPIGIAVAIAAALVALGVVLYRNWQPFHDFVDGLADGFRNAANSAVKWLSDIPARLGGLGALLYNIIFPPALRAALAKVGLNLPGAGQVGATIEGRARGASSAAPVAGHNPSVTALTSVAQQLGINPNDLLAVAFKESALNPAARNKDSNASGLIQFLPSTLRDYGLTPEQVRSMTPEQQAPYILRYLKEHGVRAGMNLDQVYAAVFAGNANRAGRTLYTTADGKAYSDNEGLDLDKDGRITSAEAAEAAASAWAKAAPTFAPNITINAYGTPSPQYAQDIGAAAGGAVNNLYSNFALEGGAGQYGGGRQ